MESPLNINLIIPFKDNSNLAKSTMKQRLVDFQGEISSRVSEISADLESLFGGDFGLQIKQRNSRGIINYYWRISGIDTKSKFRRLSDTEVLTFLNTKLTREQRIILVKVERELLCLNANVRASKLIEQNIDMLISDEEALIETQLHKMGL